MCNNSDFVHLHCHSHFSVQDALPSPYELVTAASQMGFGAIALTDHGRMSGTIQFVDACKRQESLIKPIIGLEVYTTHDMLDKSAPQGRRRPKHNHLTLLAKNHIGYQNLLKISSIAASEGFYYDPRVDINVLRAHSQGIIALSGCLASEINQALLRDDYEQAKRTTEIFKDTFENFFIELQFHGTKSCSMEEQKHNLPLLIKLAKDFNLPMVASNDVHYIDPADWRVHDVLIQTKGLRDKTFTPGLSGKQKAYASHQFYLKSADQMYKIFGDKVPESISNSVMIGEMVEDYFKLDTPHKLPKAIIPCDTDFQKFKEEQLPYHNNNDAYLAYIGFEGLKKLGLDQNKSYVNRLKKELSQIWFTGVTDYFLIQNEMISFMKENDIIYGIRGSGVASLLHYCLDISTIDPLKWGLSFERFLNPGRGAQYDITFKSLKTNNTTLLPREQAIKKLKEIVFEKLNNFSNSAQIRHKVLKELWIIENQELSNYYLELYEQQNNIQINEPNSWVAYLLNITNQKPDGDLIVTKVSELPDVDTDADDLRRGEVINWLKDRFGHDKVMNIGAWGTYAARAAVLSALKTSEKFNNMFGDRADAEAHKITASISKKPGTTIEEAIEQSSDFQYYYKKWTEEIEYAKGLVGKIANLTVHAAGVLVSSEPIIDYAPIENSKQTLCSGYDMNSISRIGGVKYDILGVKNLRMLSLCQELIKIRHNKIINLREINKEDAKVYKLFKDGQTETIFQFASPGMQDSLKLVKAESMEDLIAVVSLFRPGPLKYIPSFADRKFGKEKFSFSHELLEKHLGYTYGIIVYQDQTMFLAREMAGFTWSEADKLRKAISKKSGKDFKIMCSLFKERSLAKGINAQTVNETLELMSTFGSYAFNRAHAAAYADLAYKTAFMRVYYPIEWLAACMEIDIAKEDEMAKYIREAAKLNIPVIYPDINLSDSHVIIDDNGYIILPLTYCKGIGEESIKEIAINKPYTNFKDFIERAKPNKTIVKALAGGDAFNNLVGAKEYEDINDLIEFFDSYSKDFKKRVKLRPSNKITESKNVVRKEWAIDDLFEDF